MSHTPADDEGLFDDAFGEWLEAHGVELSPMLVGNKFVAHVDLNELKSAIMALISQKVTKQYEMAHQEGEGCQWASVQTMLIEDFDDPEDMPQNPSELSRFISQKIIEARIDELNSLYVDHNRHFDKDSCELIKQRIATLTTKQDTKENL